MKSKKKIALIFGVTGQDGSYLSKFLLKKGYQIHGVKRRSSSLNTNRIDDIYEDIHDAKNFFLHYGDLTDGQSIHQLISKINPHEIYNLGAQSHVAVSFESPEYTANCDALGILRILEAVRLLNLIEHTKIYQASTSEIYGLVQEIPQKETTPFHPMSPYGVAKLYAYWIVVNYRQSYGIFACNGILFNHESPRRGETFVTRKICRAVASIKRGEQKCLFLGNLDAKRDWGHAKDYVEGMWMITQQKKPDDFILATGKSYTVRYFVELAFSEVGIKIKWLGKGLKEVGVNSKTKEVIVKVDKKYFRPTEVDLLEGDYSKAERLLGWRPKKTFESLVSEMVKSEINKSKPYL